MSVINIPNLLKHLSILIILSGLVFGLFCSNAAIHSPMHASIEPASIDTVMITGSQLGCCTSGLSARSKEWKSVILTSPHELRSGVFSIILVLALAMAFGRLRRLVYFINRHWLVLKLYARDNPHLLLFNHLKLAFASGILNPKIY